MPGKMSSRVSCGRDFHCVPDINAALDSACKAGFDFVCMPIVNPRYKRECIKGPAKNRPGALTRSDLCLNSGDWGNLIVGKPSPWIRLDSDVDYIRTNSEAALKEELNYASRLGLPAILIQLRNERHTVSHLGLPAILIHSHFSSQDRARSACTDMQSDLALSCQHAQALKEELKYASHLGLPAILIQLRDERNMNLARLLNEHLLSGYLQQQFWIHVPLLSMEDRVDDIFDGETQDPDRDVQDTWEWWNTFRTMCDCNKRLSVALELTPDLPSEEILQRWLAEPVKAVIIPTSLFLTNKKGFPVMSKAHQGFLRSLFKLEVQLILTGVDRHQDKGIHSYYQYLDHLHQTTHKNTPPTTENYIDYLWQNNGVCTYPEFLSLETQPSPDTVSQFARGYEDYLQCPLQPLMDNLESQTYEIFEKDPIKYSQYQKAVYHALMDKISAAEKDTKSVVLMVVGAGRGPLVRASLAAAKQADRQIRKVYAVEKNPNAVVTLENLRDEMWGDQVEVVSCDMRQWKAPEKADILVSELLGSFGDNELSPECLDGAQRFLKDDGVSIPCEYTSYLAPMQSSKLYNEVRTSREKDKSPEMNFEMPYVVRLHNCQILTDPQPVFKFHHPNKDEVIDNSRFKSLEFMVDKTAVLHGFAGYFDTKLYGNVYLSIVPETHSPGMFSWFPILFPIKIPVYLKKGDKVSVDFWRRVTSKNVWYEWCLRSPTVLPIQNPKGRSYTIGL